MLLLKNVLRGLLRNKTQIISMFGIVFISIIGLFSMPASISYMKDQQVVLDQKGQTSDMELTIASQSGSQYANYVGAFGDVAVTDHDNCGKYESANDPACQSKILLDGTQGGWFLVNEGINRVLQLKANNIDATMNIEDNRNAYDPGKGWSFKVIGYNNYLDYKLDDKGNVVFVPNEYNGGVEPLLNIKTQNWNHTDCDNVKTATDPKWSYCYNAPSFDYQYFWRNTYRALASNYTTYANKVPTNFNVKYTNDFLHQSDVPILLKGRMPTAPYEIDISPYFANHNNLSIGSKLDLNGAKFNIVGFATSSKYDYAQIDHNSLTPNNKTTGLIFTSSSFFSGAFGAAFGAQTYIYRDLSLDFSIADKSKVQEAYNVIQNTSWSDVKDNAGTPDPKSVTDLATRRTFAQNWKSYDGLGNHDSQMIGTVDAGGFYRIQKDDILNLRYNGSSTFANRTDFLPTTILLFDKLLYAFVFIIAIISIAIIFIIIKKEIADDSRQIAVKKALGYTNREVANMYIIMPIIISIISTILAIIVGSIAIMFIVAFLNQFFNFSLLTVFSWSFVVEIFKLFGFKLLLVSTIPIVVVALFSWAAASILVRKKVLDLLASR